MAQTYTLDEAAQRLGVPVDEFKRRIKDDWKALRSFRDGATLRFRSSDIDELARSLGEASDPGLQLSKPEKAPRQPTSSEEFLLAPEDMTPTDDSDDIFSVAAGDSGKTKKPKSPSDSDVRLEPDSGPKSAKVKKPGKSSGKIKGGSGNLTEEIDLDALAGPKSGVLRPGGTDSSQKLKANKSGPNLSNPTASNKIPGPPPTDDIMGSDSSSEFELSLDTDSDSFELQLNTDGSEEIDLGGDPAGRNVQSQSGINLGNPRDSGVSLEKKGPDSGTLLGKTDPDDSDDFELSLDSDSSELDASSPMESSPLAEQTGRDDSDSEFELSLDDNSGVTDNLVNELEDENKGDIFETDFSIPPVSEADAESASEVVEVESSDTDLENSDFDLALDESDIQTGEDESASQVVLLDDDSSPQEPVGRRGAAAAGAAAAAAAAGRRKRRDDDEVEDDDDDASTALAGARRRTDEDDEEEAAPTGYAPPAKWPGWIIAPLALTFLFTFLGGIMSYELLKGMWGYHNGQSTTGGLANMVAGGLGLEPDAK